MYSRLHGTCVCVCVLSLKKKMAVAGVRLPRCFIRSAPCCVSGPPHSMRSLASRFCGEGRAAQWAACANAQFCVELPIDDRPRGVFTYMFISALLKALAVGSASFIEGRLPQRACDVFLPAGLAMTSCVLPVPSTSFSFLLYIAQNYQRVPSPAWTVISSRRRPWLPAGSGDRDHRAVTIYNVAWLRRHC